MDFLQSLYGSKMKLTSIGTWNLMPAGTGGTSRLVAMTLSIEVDVYRFYQEPAGSGFSLVKFGYTTNETYCIPAGVLAKLDIPQSVRICTFYFVQVTTRSSEARITRCKGNIIQYILHIQHCVICSVQNVYGKNYSLFSALL
jgi:hypothetical protein